jgi:hypothetical protein
MGVQFAASDQAANSLVADVQSTSDGWNVEQLTVISLRTGAVRSWHCNTSCSPLKNATAKSRLQFGVIAR